MSIKNKIEEGKKWFHSIKDDKEITSSKEHMKEVMSVFPQAIMYATAELQEDDELLEMASKTPWVLNMLNNEKATNKYLEIKLLGGE